MDGSITAGLAIDAEDLGGFGNGQIIAVRIESGVFITRIFFVLWHGGIVPLWRFKVLEKVY